MMHFALHSDLGTSMLFTVILFFVNSIVAFGVV